MDFYKKLIMKLISLILFAGLCNPAINKEAIYVGSTPVESTVRKFFGISLTDSIDFMRWNLTILNDTYKASVEYGLAKNGTPGFTNGKHIVLSGKLKKEDNYYYLVNRNKTLSIESINSNLLHLLDENKNMLIGNGGYSYGLSNTHAVKSNKIDIPIRKYDLNEFQVYEGRTPCQEISDDAGMNKGPECYKMKWYMILYTDPATHQPSYYLKGGRGYRKETMDRGKWKATHGKDGRTIYTLSPEKEPWSFNLVQIDDNILVFTDKEGNLLVGNEEFSYTLNRRMEEHRVTR
jgi:hypothetical protein